MLIVIPKSSTSCMQFENLENRNLVLCISSNLFTIFLVHLWKY